MPMRAPASVSRIRRAQRAASVISSSASWQVRRAAAAAVGAGARTFHLGAKRAQAVEQVLLLRCQLIEPGQQQARGCLEPSAFAGTGEQRRHARGVLPASAIAAFFKIHGPSGECAGILVQRLAFHRQRQSPFVEQPPGLLRGARGSRNLEQHGVPGRIGDHGLPEFHFLGRRQQHARGGVGIDERETEGAVPVALDPRLPRQDVGGSPRRSGPPVASAGRSPPATGAPGAGSRSRASRRISVPRRWCRAWVRRRSACSRSRRIIRIKPNKKGRLSSRPFLCAAQTPRPRLREALVFVLASPRGFEPLLPP